MAYEFKKLNDVEIVETPIDTANVLIEEGGVIKKTPKSAVGGGGNNESSITICRITGNSETGFEIDKDPATLVSAALNGTPIIALYDNTMYFQSNAGYDPEWERNELILSGIRYYQLYTLLIAEDGYIFHKQQGAIVN